MVKLLKLSDFVSLPWNGAEILEWEGICGDLIGSN